MFHKSTVRLRLNLAQALLPLPALAFPLPAPKQGCCFNPVLCKDTAPLTAPEYPHRIRTDMDVRGVYQKRV
ncbi:MAG: hypothetical protein P1P58_03980 [Treponema sp.]